MNLHAAAGVSQNSKDLLVQPQQQTLRYFALYYTLVVILLFSGYFLIHYFETEKLRSVTLAAELEHVNLASKSLERDLETIGSDFRSLAASRYLADFLQTNGEASKAKLTERLLLFLTDRHIYDQARLIDASGQEVIRVSYNKGAPKITPQEQLHNKSRRYYFTDVMKLSQGSLYVSPLDLNVENGNIEVPYKPVLRIATPVFDVSGTIQGILIVNYLANSMFDQFFYQLPGDEVEKNEYSILNQDGYWLHHHNTAKEWGFMFDIKETFGTLHPNVWPQMLKQNSGQVENERGLFTFATVNPTAHVIAGINKPAHDMAGEPSSGRLEATQAQQRWKVLSYVQADRLGIGHSGLVNWPFIWILSILLVFSAFGSWLVAKATSMKKQTEAALHVLSQAVEQNPAMVLITDKDGGIEYVNLRFCKNTGYEKSEIVGQNPKVLNA